MGGLGGWKSRFICNSTVDAKGACDTKGLWMQPRHLLQDYFDISKLSISSLRGHKFLVFILPCLSPSPDTLARGRLSRTFCFQPCLYSAMVSLLVVPPADKGGGNVFMPCFGVPWCSLSCGYVDMFYHPSHLGCTHLPCFCGHKEVFPVIPG